MTNQDMIDMVQVNIPPETPQRLTLAKMSLEAAIESLGKEDITPWNKRSTTFNLTADKGTYVLGDDILTDYDNIKGISQLWLTSEEDWPVKIYSPDLFNHYRRGNTNTGKPYLATIVNNDTGKLTLEIFYTPDSAYELWTLLRVSLTLDMIPDDFHDLVWSKAIIFSNKVNSPFYNKGIEIYNESYEKLKKVSYRKWDGTFIKPDIIIGGGIKSSLSDSSNLWGLR